MRLLPVIALLLLPLFASCTEEKKTQEFVARVNDTYLTREELFALVDSSEKNKEVLLSVIQEWVKKEVLYQRALKEDINTTEEYKVLLARTEKEILAGLLLRQLIDEEEFTVHDDEIKTFYSENKEEFVLTEPAYLYDCAYFSNEQSAFEARKKALEKNWKTAERTIPGLGGLLKFEQQAYRLQSQIESGMVSRIIREMLPGEVSVILNPRPGMYLIIYLRDKYDAGTVPPVDVIKENIRERLLEVKRKIFLEEYLKEQYAKSDIDINREYSLIK